MHFACVISGVAGNIRYEIVIAFISIKTYAEVL